MPGRGSSAFPKRIGVPPSRQAGGTLYPGRGSTTSQGQLFHHKPAPGPNRSPDPATLE